MKVPKHMMGKWHLLTDVADFVAEFNSLNIKNKGHFFTNYQPLTSEIQNEIKYTELFYSRDCDNLFLIKRWDDFYKLIYACNGNDIINLHFPSSVEKSVLVIDIFEKEGHEKQTVMKEKFIEQGFKEYKSTHLWKCEGHSIERNDKPTLHENIDGDKSWFFSIYDYFDSYSDAIPTRGMMNDYCRNAENMSYSINESFVGGIVYHTKGKAITEDYIFVTMEHRGVGGMIQSLFLSKCFGNKEIKIIYAWINDDNIASIKMHERNGFIRTNQYKVTLLRDGNTARCISDSRKDG